MNQVLNRMLPLHKTNIGESTKTKDEGLSSNNECRTYRGIIMNEPTKCDRYYGRGY
jgi:hypothetical protein